MNLWYEKGEKTYFRTGEYVDEPQCPDERKVTRFARGKGCKNFKLICRGGCLSFNKGIHNSVLHAKQQAERLKSRERRPEVDRLDGW